MVFTLKPKLEKNTHKTHTKQAQINKLISTKNIQHHIININIINIMDKYIPSDLETLTKQFVEVNNRYNLYSDEVKELQEKLLDLLRKKEETLKEKNLLEKYLDDERKSLEKKNILIDEEIQNLLSTKNYNLSRIKIIEKTIEKPIYETEPDFRDEPGIMEEKEPLIPDFRDEPDFRNELEEKTNIVYEEKEPLREIVSLDEKKEWFHEYFKGENNNQQSKDVSPKEFYVDNDDLSRLYFEENPMVVIISKKMNRQTRDDKNVEVTSWKLWTKDRNTGLPNDTLTERVFITCKYLTFRNIKIIDKNVKGLGLSNSHVKAGRDKFYEWFYQKTH